MASLHQAAKPRDFQLQTPVSHTLTIGPQPPGQPRLHLPAHGDTQGCMQECPCLDSMPGPWAARPWVLTISDSRICPGVSTVLHSTSWVVAAASLHTPVLREPPLNQAAHGMQQHYDSSAIFAKAL